MPHTPEHAVPAEDDLVPVLLLDFPVLPLEGVHPLQVLSERVAVRSSSPAQQK